MQMFQGFKPEGMKKIQQRMGYTGPADQFQSYLQANPDKQMMMNSYVNKAMNMASGGYVRNFQAGGYNLPEGFNPVSYKKANPDIQAGIDAGQFTSAADHYQKFGGGEDRQGVTGFSVPTNFTPQNYINPDINPDLAADFEQRKQTDPNLTAQQYAVEHFTNFGGAEDRPGVTTVLGLPDGPEGESTGTGTSAGQVAADAISGTLPAPPDPNRTFATLQELASIPNESLTPEQQHIRNFYASTPEQQEAINAMPQFSNAQLPVGQYQPGVRTAAPPPPQEGAGAGTGDTVSGATGAGDTVSGATGVGSVNGTVVLANRPDVAQAITDGNTFGVDPATLEGLTPEQRNQRLAEAWFNTFGNKEGVNPNTGLSNTPSNFDNVSDQVIMDYLDQYPDLREAFGGPPYSQATLAQARAHYADFGRKEIAEGGRAGLVVFDLSPEQLELMRFANDEYKDLTPEELRRTYIQMGGNIPNFDRGATLLNGSQLQLLRDEFPDLANLNDYELQQHFIQFGRQEMLDGTRKKLPSLVPPVSPYAGLTSIADISAARLETPVLADGTRLDAQGIPIAEGTDIATTAGQLSATDPTATAGTATAPTGATATPEGTSLAQVADTTKTKTDVQTVTDATTGQTMSLTKAKPDAAQQTTSAVSGQTAETGTGIKIDPDTQVQRAAITEAETVGATAVASDAANFIEAIKAQSDNPTANATVAGQMKNLLEGFDASNPPPWAAGAMRAANAEMLRRGLPVSSMAAQAIMQAAMESALPIAQADAQIQAQFEGQNLSNRQQMAMLYAQQRASFMGQEFDQGFQSRVINAARVADIADKNFTAQQQVQLENSNIVNTMNLSNLSNKQAVQMAEIASLAQLDISNLNNRQQAAVMEAQAFLQKDMTDVSNAQQTTLFNAQQRIQSLFTDSAADNARKQFNASSDNQSNQFFANLATQTSQFNDAQKNAIAQFNAGQQGTVSRFNAEIENQRDQFNAQNRLVIDQANAVWRRQIATADTAAQNRVNELNASALLDISNTAYSDLWQQYSDMIEFAYTSAENELDRIASLAEANINADTRRDIQAEASSTAAGSAIGNLVGTLGAAFIGAKFK